MEGFQTEELKILYNSFVDESLEKLSDFENTLLKIEGDPSKEDIHTIFRTVHTIKGTSSSLGFGEISRFAHGLEEYLDLLRKDKIALSDKGLNMLFEACDLLKKAILSIRSGEFFDFTECDRVLEKLNVEKERTASRIYKIIFTPDREIIKKGFDPSIIIESLRSIGEIINIRAFEDAVPPLNELNPEMFYLRWDIIFKTDCGTDAINEVFEFVQEGSEIKILPLSIKEDEPAPLGRLLIENGAVNQEDIEDAIKKQRRLGTILVEDGKVTGDEVEAALNKQNLQRIELLSKTFSSTIRVDLKKLDDLINLVGEMIILHSMIERVIKKGGVQTSIADEISLKLHRLDREIQERTMSLRMLPVGEVFRRFIRLVRELSLSKNKKVKLLISGEETELDKSVIEKITDPLVHLLRNAIDHGIELPEERLLKGKDPEGIISLTAYQRGDSIFIEVEDDGRGLDKESILKRAVSQGMIRSDQILTDEEIYSLVFIPGFSTSDTVTDVSGRGVGMDVVKKNIEALNGRVYIYTEKDRGTVITIKLPLTLAIIEGLSIITGNEIFMLPMHSVVELIRPERRDIFTVEGKAEILNLRGENIPLIRLHEILDIKPSKENIWDMIVVITMYEDKKYGLVVDDIVGHEQIVLKNPGTSIPRVKEIGGFTIAGDGRVALVLDVPGIIEMAMETVKGGHAVWH